MEFEKDFSGFNTSKDILSEWLIDSMITFFSSFSNAWMSDLTSKEKAIESKRSDIIKADIQQNQLQ